MVGSYQYSIQITSDQQKNSNKNRIIVEGELIKKKKQISLKACRRMKQILQTKAGCWLGNVGIIFKRKWSKTQFWSWQR